MYKDDNCLAKLQSLLPSLKGVLLKAGFFIIEHPDEVLESSIADLASRIGIAESSIIRLCRKLGYSGFSALKISLAGSLRQSMQYSLDDITFTTDEMSAFDTVKHVFAQTQNALNETLQIISEKELSHAADIISEADTIVFFGIGSSAPIAHDAFLRFSRLGIRVSYAADPYSMLLSANYIVPGSVAVGISHTGRSKETIRALQMAKEKNAQTICITSYMDSPITKYSDVKLITSSAENSIIHEAVTSRIAHLSLLDSLYTFLVIRNYDTSSKKLDEVDRIMRNARE